MQRNSTELQKNALYLLQVLQKVHESLSHFVESLTFQQQQAFVSVILDLDAAQFGLSRVESRLELAKRNVFVETSRDQEVTEVGWDLLGVQRNLYDGFQKIVTYLLDRNRVTQPEVSSTGKVVSGGTEDQITTTNFSKSFRDSQELETQDSNSLGRSVGKNMDFHLQTSCGRSYMIALYNFEGQEADELSFRKGDHIQVVAYDTSGWWLGQLHGKYGLFPANYTRKMHNRHSATW
ncbi:GRB2-related adaptor protein 2 [Galdieria sulphuraria]|uniref:GRB2-related adaptor protein 2 n=1 Tax=Galdieria sulphuraria TaxID=130081 RepID=M2XWL3_GALSU|nr:GRB2-related adaptor protein 2 [Galdieria sulphuraria]EME27819.1 GRB2-related adaptor protein 2 [Galdieria sulphuraria]|eukprot:XP_005704339.1 GRB2-related adaptor protein 2 [Galdieria sulphuraria]